MKRTVGVNRIPWRLKVGLDKLLVLLYCSVAREPLITIETLITRTRQWVTRQGTVVGSGNTHGLYIRLQIAVQELFIRCEWGVNNNAKFRPWPGLVPNSPGHEGCFYAKVKRDRAARWQGQLQVQCRAAPSPHTERRSGAGTRNVM